VRATRYMRDASVAQSGESLGRDEERPPETASTQKKGNPIASGCEQDRGGKQSKSKRRRRRMAMSSQGT
jgi:hypothetical protein